MYIVISYYGYSKQTEIAETEKETKNLQMRMIWKEMKEWRKHWSCGIFFLGLVFGLGVSLFDFGTDFNFAWSVEEDCGFEETERYNFDSPCGSVHYKNAERLTFTFIAYPGIFLSFAAIHRVVKELVSWCQGGEVQGLGQRLARVAVISFEVCVFFGLFAAAMWNDEWSKTTTPSTVKVYDYTILSLAFLSATLAVGGGKSSVSSATDQNAAV